MIKRLLGANYKTTLTGIGAWAFSALTFLSGLSYDLGPIALVIPAKYKPTVTLVSGIAASILWAWNSISQKSKEVTGGSVAQTLDGSVAKPGTQTLVDITKATTDASNGKPQLPPKTI